MKITLNNKGFSVLEGLIVLFVLFLIGLAGYNVWKYGESRDNSNGTQLRTEVSNSPEACKTTKELKICLSSDKTKVSASENLEITTTITNLSERTITETFNCTATDPVLLLNNEIRFSQEVCGQAITPASYKSGISKSFNKKINGSDLNEGDNRLKAKWASFESDELIIQREKLTDRELSKQFKECQAVDVNYKTNDIPGYCERVQVLLKESIDKQIDCNGWKEILKSVDLNVPCTEMMEIGVAYVYVPRQDTSQYVDRIKNIPQVEEVR